MGCTEYDVKITKERMDSRGPMTLEQKLQENSDSIKKLRSQLEQLSNELDAEAATTEELIAKTEQLLSRQND